MNNINGPTPRPSYFWSCLTLSGDCPFFSNRDPNLFYFGVALLCFYGAFILVILADFNFYRSLDGLQNQIHYYVNLVRKKVRRVQIDQKRLVSTRERTEKQMKMSEECQRIVNAVRNALDKDETPQLTISSNEDVPKSSARRATWSECHSVVD